MRSLVSCIKYFVFSIGFSLLLLIFSWGTVHASEEVYYIYSDHLGSNSVVTKDGVEVERIKYFPYGSERLRISNPIYRISEKGYTGQISDKGETGLLYFNARYYDPSTAKFITPDLIGVEQNKYIYSRNSPIINIDPTGHFPCYKYVESEECETQSYIKIPYIGISLTVNVTSEDTSIDLAKYQAIYTAMAFGAKAMGYNLSTELMLHYLYGNSKTDYDVSNYFQNIVSKQKPTLLARYIGSNPYFPIFGWKINNKGRIANTGSISSVLGGLDESTKFDIGRALGTTTYKISKKSISRYGYSEIDDGVWGAYVTDPVIEIYDVYNFGEKLITNGQVPLPGGGWLGMSGQMGANLESAGWVDVFKVVGAFKVPGDYFIPLEKREKQPDNPSNDINSYYPKPYYYYPGKPR